jgi:hypothetical protein
MNRIKLYLRRFTAFIFVTCFVCICKGEDRNFEIRGVLPWHNFLSGPSAWNEKDYEEYLDLCKENDINFIGFHNYTGGGERYATYVEPMIKISYNGIIPEAYFDHSLSARWGYLPLALSQFSKESRSIFNLPMDATAFGSDCAITSKTKEAHYTCVQKLMKNVLRMAHERNIRMAMGFEFGVLPPEYFSLSMQDDCFYWRGEANMIPNPCHPIAINLHLAAIDNILEVYPDVDYIWLWLNELSYMGVNFKTAMQDEKFAAIYQEKSHYFTAASNEEKFIGVWALTYLELTCNYLKKVSPKTKIILGGWGRENQLPIILQGLNDLLPDDITFSCLNPSLGLSPQPDFLKHIAKKRNVWAIPWLEGDHQLWHFQPRVTLLSEHIKLAKEQNLSGVVAIHWRTKEIKYNFKAFAHFAKNPDSPLTIYNIYHQYIINEMGEYAADRIAPLLLKMDTEQIHANIPSPEFYAYTPVWGIMNEKNIAIRSQILEEINYCLAKENDASKKIALNDMKAMFKFELLLDRVGRAILPAYKLKNKTFQKDRLFSQEYYREIYNNLLSAPIDEMLTVYISKITSRGEMGVLSSINQRLYSEYVRLKSYLETNE